MDLLNTILAISPTLMKVIQFFAALSILIIVHEFGHFMFAKLFKTRVEKFYLFFDFFFPFANFMNFSLFKKKFKGTEYGLGWFPLGGYVKISGMVDESADKEAMKGEPQPWEYRSKKSWQKLLIMLGGIIMNVLLAMLIYVIIYANYGEKYLLPENVKYGIQTDSLGKSIGLMDGDVITKVGDQVVKDEHKVVYNMIFSDKKTFTVNRGGTEKTIKIPDGTIRKSMKIMKAKRQPIFSIRFPAQIDSIQPNCLNKDSLKVGDRMLTVNGKPAVYHQDFMREFSKVIKKDSLSPVMIELLRGGDTVTVAAKLNNKSKTGKLGLVWQTDMDEFFDVTHIPYTAGEAIPRGIKETKEKLKEYMLQLRLIFTSPEVKISESLGGFGSIGGMFPGKFSMHMFLQLTAFISIILAFMNLLPIPGLDGGYVLFLLFEMITGVKVSDNVIEKANGVGLVLLLALMLYANGLDVVRWFTGS